MTHAKVPRSMLVACYNKRKRVYSNDSGMFPMQVLLSESRVRSRSRVSQNGPLALGIQFGTNFISFGSTLHRLSASFLHFIKDLQRCPSGSMPHPIPCHAWKAAYLNVKHGFYLSLSKACNLTDNWNHKTGGNASMQYGEGIIGTVCFCLVCTGLQVSSFLAPTYLAYFKL